MFKKGKWEILCDKLHIFVCKRLKEGHAIFLRGFNFLCKILKIAKCFILKSKKLMG